MAYQETRQACNSKINLYGIINCTALFLGSNKNTICNKENCPKQKKLSNKKAFGHILTWLELAHRDGNTFTDAEYIKLLDDIKGMK